MPRRNRSDFLVGPGRMTAGEKRAIANWYLTWEATGRRPRRSEIDRLYPYTKADVKKLVARGLMELVEDRSGNTLIDATPQGKAVAKMVLGLTRPKRRKARRRNPSGVWRAYEIGVWSPGLGALIETLATVSGPPGVPISQVKKEAARKLEVPVRLVRLREMLSEDPHWF